MDCQKEYGLLPTKLFIRVFFEFHSLCSNKLLGIAKTMAVLKMYEGDVKDADDFVVIVIAALRNLFPEKDFANLFCNLVQASSVCVSLLLL